MEKYCPSCGRVLGEVDFKFCPYCKSLLNERVGREPIPRKLRHKVFVRDNYRCVECGATNKETTLEIDHIIPVAKGGTNDISNLQTLCKKCNRAKYTDVWIPEKRKNSLSSNKRYIRKIRKNTKTNLGRDINSLGKSLFSELCKNLNVPSSIEKKSGKIDYLLNNYSNRIITEYISEIKHNQKLKQLGIEQYSGFGSNFKENTENSYKNDPRVLKLAIKYGNEEKYKDEIEEYKNKLHDISSKAISFEEKLEIFNDKGIDFDLKSKKIICPYCGKKILFSAYDIHHKCLHCGYKF